MYSISFAGICKHIHVDIFIPVYQECFPIPITEMRKGPKRKGDKKC